MASYVVPTLESVEATITANPGKNKEDVARLLGLPSKARSAMWRQYGPELLPGGRLHKYVKNGTLRATKKPLPKEDEAFTEVPHEAVETTVAKPKEPEGLDSIDDSTLKSAAERAIKAGADKEKVLLAASVGKKAQALVDELLLAAMNAARLEETNRALVRTAEITAQWKEEYRLRILAETKLERLEGPQEQEQPRDRTRRTN